jgi:hypothetical protein
MYKIKSNSQSARTFFATNPMIVTYLQKILLQIAECVRKTKYFLPLCKNILAYYKTSVVVNSAAVGSIPISYPEMNLGKYVINM